MMELQLRALFCGGPHSARTYDACETVWRSLKGDKNIYYTCPTYKAPKRTGLNYISSFEMRTDESAMKWTLRGVCLLTTID